MRVRLGCVCVWVCVCVRTRTLTGGSRVGVELPPPSRLLPLPLLTPPTGSSLPPALFSLKNSAWMWFPLVSDKNQNSNNCGKRQRGRGRGRKGGVGREGEGRERAGGEMEGASRGREGGGEREGEGKGGRQLSLDSDSCRQPLAVSLFKCI